MTDRLAVIKATQEPSTTRVTSASDPIVAETTENPLKFHHSEIIKFTTSYINTSDFVTEDYNYNNPDYFEIDSFTERFTEESTTFQPSVEPIEMFDFNISKIFENVTDFFESDYNSSQFMANSSFMIEPFMNYTNYTITDVQNAAKFPNEYFLENSDHQNDHFSNFMAQPHQNYIEVNNLNASTQLEIRRY